MEIIMKISQANPIIATDTLKKDAGKTTKQLDILENSSQKNLKTLQPSISKIANTLTAQQNVLNLDSLKIGADGSTSINGETMIANPSENEKNIESKGGFLCNGFGCRPIEEEKDKGDKGEEAEGCSC